MYDLLQLCIYLLWFDIFFSRVLFRSRVTGACPVTADLIVRVNVRTTTLCTCRRNEAALLIYMASWVFPERPSGVLPMFTTSCYFACRFLRANTDFVNSKKKRIIGIVIVQVH